MQRRTEYPSPDSNRSRVSKDAMVNVLSRMSGLPLQLTQSSEEKKPVPVPEVYMKSEPQAILGTNLISTASTAELEAALALKRI